jgi:hypothetical protein
MDNAAVAVAVVETLTVIQTRTRARTVNPARMVFVLKKHANTVSVPQLPVPEVVLPTKLQRMELRERLEEPRPQAQVHHLALTIANNHREV